MNRIEVLLLVLVLLLLYTAVVHCATPFFCCRIFFCLGQFFVCLPANIVVLTGHHHGALCLILSTQFVSFSHYPCQRREEGTENSLSCWTAAFFLFFFFFFFLFFPFFFSLDPLTFTFLSSVVHHHHHDHYHQHCPTTIVQCDLLSRSLPPGSPRVHQNTQCQCQQKDTFLSGN